MGLFNDVIKTLKNALEPFKMAIKKANNDIKPVVAQLADILEKAEPRQSVYNHNLSVRKGKSQQRNWRKWRGRK